MSPGRAESPDPWSPATWARAAPVVAGVIGALEVARGLFASTPLDKYKERVGAAQMIIGLAAIVLAAGAWAAQWSRDRSERSPFLASIVVLPIVVAAAIGMEIYAYQALNNFRPQLASLNSFVPPPGVEGPNTFTDSADRPYASRTWRHPGPGPATCVAAKASLATWADPTTVRELSNNAEGCEFTARRNGDGVTLGVTVVKFPQPGSLPVIVEISIKSR